MINLICKDLRKEEVYVQIADCLEGLQSITSESFDKINAKLSALNNDLIKIERRREMVKSKIEQIKKNNNKAIQIHSPFYYPAKEIKDQYRYESLVKSSQSKRPDSKPVKCSIGQPFELFHPDDLNEMLNFCDLDTFLKTERESLNFLQGQKLNKSTIPWNRIKSISSLIIFNSSETAYIKTDQDSSIHEFKAANKQKKNEEENELNFGNIAPPKSMTKKDKFEMSFEQNLFRIDTQEAPKVLDNLPNDLPDLGAVAGDIFFNEDTPIKFTNANFSPAEPEEKATDSKQLPSKLFRIFSFDQSSTSSIEELKVSDVGKTVKHEPKNSDNGRPKPESIPMPPPLPGDSSSFESSTELEKRPAKQPVIAIDNSRASLLDAIRKAAGKPDKSKTTIKEKKLEERKNRKEAVSTDLMTDLKKHLMSRRQAMVGVKFNPQNSKKEAKRESSDVYKAMASKMTTMIPSPTSSAASSDQSDIEDWVN